jgi:hypothetical protein
VGPQTGHFSYHENQRGVTFDALFGPYLVGAQKITITDPYIRAFHQVRNVMELIETIAKTKYPADEVEVHLITCLDGIRPEKQAENLGAIAASCEGVGIKFTWEFDETNTIHARHIVTDTCTWATEASTSATFLSGLKRALLPKAVSAKTELRNQALPRGMESVPLRRSGAEMWGGKL